MFNGFLRAQREDSAIASRSNSSLRPIESPWSFFWENSSELEPLERLSPDGLPAPEVGDWAEEKYQHVRYYADIFSTSMKGKWKLAYVDLFAGAGRVTIRGTTSILPASPTIALRFPFTRYIFCDENEEKLEALKKRVTRDFPQAAATFLPGDVNGNADRILDALPYSAKEGLLTFCLVDPFAMSNLHFNTISRLSDRKVDFLVLVPSGHDFQRWQATYLDPSNRVVEDFLGDSAWRKAWEAVRDKGKVNAAAEFIADRFGRQMSDRLGYIYRGLDAARVVRSTDRNLLLYHLLLFSRHKLGAGFWETTLEGVDPQGKLF